MSHKRLTGKQERFCRLFIKNGGNAAEAYRGAYEAQGMKDATVHRAAHEVLHNPKVGARIERMRERAAEIAHVTLAGHIQALGRIRELAIKKGQLSAAARAEQLRGEVSGFYTEPGRLRDPAPPPEPQPPVPSEEETARALLLVQQLQRKNGKRAEGVS